MTRCMRGRGLPGCMQGLSLQQVNQILYYLIRVVVMLNCGSCVELFGSLTQCSDGSHNCGHAWQTDQPDVARSNLHVTKQLASPLTLQYYLSFFLFGPAVGVSNRWAECGCRSIDFSGFVKHDAQLLVLPLFIFPYFFNRCRPQMGSILQLRLQPHASTSHNLRQVVRPSSFRLRTVREPMPSRRWG